MSRRTKAVPVGPKAGIGRGILGGLLIVVLCFSAAFADGNEKLGITLPKYKGKYDVGVVSLGSFGLRGDATTLMKIPENAQIIAAYVYMSGYSNLTPDQLGDILVTVSNGQDTKTKAAKCIGYSQEGDKQRFTYRADVSDVVTIGEKRYHVQSKQLPAQPTSGRLYGGGLVAIYSLPNYPESEIWIADGLDFFAASQGYPATSTVVFPFSGNRFERYGSVKIFAGMDQQNTASAIWYQVGHGNPPQSGIIDQTGAVDYNNSSNSNPSVDTDPIQDGLGVRRAWSMVEFMIPVGSEQDWAAFQLESQTDNSNKQPMSGVWNMVAFKLPLEETGIGVIGDRVFHDKNKNKVRDQMEAGIPAVLVSLYQDNGDNTFDPNTDTFVDSVRTNRLGFYIFQNLKFGTYFVDIFHPRMNESGVELTTNNDPAGPIQVVDGNAILDVDFGFCYTGQRGNRQLQFNSFNFQSDTNGVWLNWSTFAGTENLGFDVFRSLSQMGSFTLINPNVIPAANNQNGFNNYSFFDPDVEPGQTYYYKISDVTMDGAATATYGPVAVTAGTTRIAEETSALIAPADYELGNAYPNPFNGQTAIQYSLARPAEVSIAIYNLQGQKIRTLLAERQAAGNHTIYWNGHDELNQPVGSGVYLYRITINNTSQAKRVVYLK